VRLVPLLLRPSGRRQRWTRLDADTFLQALVPRLERFQDDQWLAQVVNAIERFWQRRVARERSIAHSTVVRATTESQPGLFDRRVERAQVARLEAERESVASVQRRLAVIARRSSVAAAGIHAALILQG
jgi:hypothetical protein